MSYCLGSLNLRGGKRAEKHKRFFYEFIYNVVTRENLAIFAFQEDAEVRSNSVIDDILGTSFGITTPLSQRGWEGFHMPGPDKGSEFSFIWDSNRVQACTTPGFPEARTIKMFRKPLCGDFAAVGTNSFTYEFRLINIHIWYTGGKENRMLGCGYVKNEIYEEIQLRIPEVIRHVFTVALGDYNLNCDDCNLCGPDRVRTFLSDYTTINEMGDYRNSYDHFSFDIVKNKTIRYKPTRIDVLQYCDSMEYYFNNVSNHVPIKLEIF